ncbi:MAG: class I tRNA ligase family protein [Candidatus Nomurabacteria bacterium]|jgi:isoleucyl-tRNA synthetase|nr:class I tRNA ligase family protein [Candidatus Nomurabacteria bacterium]
MKYKYNTRRRAVEYEKDIAKKWKKDKTFEKSIAQRDPANAYVFYDGPPFITGSPHHGTLLSSVVKDVIPRYQTMKGKRVERVWGWDCHGLPAENFVEKQLGIEDRRQIGATAPIEKDGKKLAPISLAEYVTKARESMVANSALWESYIDRVGRWVDFRGAYRTMDKDFMESVWWAFQQLYNAGKIYEGKKVLMYDTKFATPVSKAEVTMDNDAYQTVTDPSVFVKFKVKDKQPNIMLSRDSKILFVCWANISRSQTAKAIYNKLIGDNIAESAGVGVEKEQPEGTTIAERNKIVSEELGIENYQSKAQILLLEKHGIDITHEPRKQLTPEMLKDYDLVVNIAEKFQTPDWFRGENVIWWDIKDPGILKTNEAKMEAMKTAMAEIEKRAQDLMDGKVVDDCIDEKYLLAWTTTPWTLPANMALAVNPKLKYVEAAVDGEILILARDLAEKVLADRDYKILREITGSDLAGLEYEPLFAEENELSGKIGKLKERGRK